MAIPLVAPSPTSLLPGANVAVTPPPRDTTLVDAVSIGFKAFQEAAKKKKEVDNLIAGNNQWADLYESKGQPEIAKLIREKNKTYEPTIFGDYGVNPAKEQENLLGGAFAFMKMETEADARRANATVNDAARIYNAKLAATRNQFGKAQSLYDSFEAREAMNERNHNELRVKPGGEDIPPYRRKPNPYAGELKRYSDEYDNVLKTEASSLRSSSRGSVGNTTASNPYTEPDLPMSPSGSSSDTNNVLLSPDIVPEKNPGVVDGGVGSLFNVNPTDPVIGGEDIVSGDVESSAPIPVVIPDAVTPAPQVASAPSTLGSQSLTQQMLNSEANYDPTQELSNAVSNTNQDVISIVQQRNKAKKETEKVNAREAFIAPLDAYADIARLRKENLNTDELTDLYATIDEAKREINSIPDIETRAGQLRAAGIKTRVDEVADRVLKEPTKTGRTERDIVRYGTAVNMRDGKNNRPLFRDNATGKIYIGNEKIPITESALDNMLDMSVDGGKVWRIDMYGPAGQEAATDVAAPVTNPPSSKPLGINDILNGTTTRQTVNPRALIQP